MEEAMKVVGYTRVSTDKQADEGVSLNLQAEKIRSYCQLYNLELVDLIEDSGESAKDLNRPGVQMAIGMMDRKIVQGIVVYKLDRLTRSILDMGNLIQKYFDKGTRLISVQEQIDTSSATGKFFLNIMMSFSQYERELIGERTRAAMRHKISRNEHAGEIPFGKRLGPDKIHLEDSPEEQRSLTHLRHLRNAGFSIRKIADRLNLDGLPARGKRWHPTSVANILRREGRKS
jgi:DNA invertase Pin-like site-specific DNA recombinase